MKNVKILIVDDIYFNRILLTEIIKKIGWTSKDAKSGRQAVEKLKAEDFDLILMDIEMPDINGYEATEIIRQNLPYPKNQTPIIAITAYDIDSFSEEYAQAGFNTYISKPYTIDKISGVLSNYI